MIAFIGLGSNLGNKKENISTAIQKIAKKNIIQKHSSLYRTEPIGYKEQDDFLNCAIKIETQLNPKDLLDFLLNIEHEMKRVREIKSGPRIIDLDILFYDNKKIKNNNLEIPHPALHKRKFVLVPLVEIEPELLHPNLNKTVKEILTTCIDTGKVEIVKP